LTRSRAFYFLGARRFNFFSPFQPAIRYIFFAIATDAKSSVELFPNRNAKKGCRYYRGYVEVSTIYQTKKPPRFKRGGF